MIASKMMHPTEAKTLTEAAYRVILQHIISGHAPPASRLQISELCKMCSSSASAIREALSRLASEGLVTITEQKGFRVAPMSEIEFEDITSLRILLEQDALRRSIQLGGDDWEARIVAAHHKLARTEKRLKAGEVSLIDEWEQRNREFHDSLVSACGSDWLLRLRKLLFVHSQRYRLQSLTGGPVMRDSSIEHKRLLTSAMERKADEVCRLIARHFSTTYEDYKAGKRIAQRTRRAAR